MRFTFRIKAINFKKHTEFDETFTSGNVYWVSGKTELGKTSLLQMIRSIFRVDNPNPNIIQWGKKNTSVEIDITKEDVVTLGDGEKYIAKMEKVEGKEEKFSLLMPDATVRKSKKDIRNILQYNDFTIEDFLGWGLTESGRRKQAETITQFLPDNAKNRITEIDKNINTKSGILYVTRSGKNEVYQGLKKIYEGTVPLSIDEEKMLSNESKTIETLNSIKEEFDALQTLLRGDNENIMKRENLIANLNSYKAEKLRIEQRLAELNKSISLCEEELATIPDTNFDSAKFDELKSRKEKGEVYLSQIKEVRRKFDSRIENEQKMLVAQKEWKNIDDKIDLLRKEKQAIFDNAKLPMENIIIDDGELFYIEDGNRLNFCEEQVSYSRAGINIIRLLLELNKNLPFICIGHGESYASKEKQDILFKLAKEYNAVLLCDQVVMNQEELRIDIYEPSNG